MATKPFGPAYWEEGGGGVLETILIREYVGNGANSREIDLGDDYQEIVVRLKLNTESANAPIQAWAIQTNYGTFSLTASYWGTNANNFFQGKMTGADANKIKLGVIGGHASGANVNSYTYQIVAKKYSTVSP